MLHHYIGMRHVEIAETLDVPVGTVKSRIHIRVGDPAGGHRGRLAEHVGGLDRGAPRMNEREFDRIAEDFLADGPTVLADRVFDAALDEVHLTRQRRGLRRARWRFPNMNTYAKFAVAGVVVIAVGFLGLTLLRPAGTGIGGPPAATPSPVATATPTTGPTAPPLTGRFTSERHGFSIAYPETWSARPATTAWISGLVDFTQDSGDLLYEPSNPGNIWLALASQPLGDRTAAQWEADVRQFLVDDDPETATCSSAAVPITIDGAPGTIACNLALVTAGGRGYYVLLYVSGDDPGDAQVYDAAWFASVLASMELNPEDAVDGAATPTPS